MQSFTILQNYKIKLMKKFTKLFFAAILTLMSLVTLAQQGDTLEIHHKENGEISFVRFKPDINRKIQDAANFLKALLHANQDDQFQLIKETTDTLGISHRRYQQYYKGIKVENAEYLVHGKNGIIETINGDFQQVNISTVVASVSEQQAINNALIFVNAQKYKWEDRSLENLLKKNTNNPNATYYPKGELVITKDFLKGGNNLKLAWKFMISSLIPNNEQLVYVDATMGDVIRTTPLVYDVNTPCTAQTRYSGTLAIIGDSFAGGFRLRENRNGVDVQTLNLQGGNNYANAIDFANANTNFTNGNWPTFNQNQAALDAHWGAENILDYWRVVQNRNSIDGNGIRVLGYVHYSPTGTGWNNAQWVAGANNHFMQYGDGDGIIFNPLTALDICAHEMGHGIDEFTANLTPGTQESGALNEGFSDIWGACVEHRSAPTKQTWLIGEDIFIGGVFTCIRNLQNPKTTTASEGQHPDTYHGSFWDNNGEPHINSTVLSHWFYLLSQGGNGTNDIGSVFNVNGIGIDNAQLIAYRTELLYLTSSANYTAARTGSIQAARDLYGIGSCQEIAVTNAWFAVGVGAAYTGNGGFSISGDNIFCTTSTDYSIPNLPTGATVTWSVTPSGIATPNSPNSTQTTLAKNASGVITLTATITNACGGQTFTVTKPNISVGTPFVGGTFTNTFDGSSHPLGYYPDVTNPACTGYNINTNMQISGASSVTWTKVSSTGVVNYTQNGNDISFYLFADNQYVLFRLDASNVCGTTSDQFKWLSSNCSGGGGGCLAFTVSPNPATNSINVIVPDIPSPCDIVTSGDSKTTALQRSITEIKIYDNIGNLRKTQKENKTKQATINLTGLKSGVYIVEITDGSYKERQQIIVQK
jgi:bacillolysin